MAEEFSQTRRSVLSPLHEHSAGWTVCQPQPYRLRVICLDKSSNLANTSDRLFRSPSTKPLFVFEITAFDVCFILKLLLVSQPANHQEDAEQKLLSASLLLVAIETQAMMESRRVWGRVGRREAAERTGQIIAYPYFRAHI